MDYDDFDLLEHFPKRNVPKKKNKTRLFGAIFTITAVLTAVGAAVVFIVRPMWFSNQALPAESLIVPWNPGGTADLVAQALANQIEPGIPVQNMPGANGALGLQAVYNTPHDGKTLLGTNVSAFVSAQMMGFTEISHKDWDIWFTAYAPSLIVVNANAPYLSFSDLLTAFDNKPGELRCANAGNGSLSFIAAHKLRTGELRALAAMGEGPLQLEGVTHEIPSIINDLPEAASVIPFGDVYGIWVPKDTDADVLNRFGRQWKDAVSSDAYATFASDKGLILLNYDRNRSADLTEKMAEWVCWTLYNTGCVNISPDTIGILNPS